MEEKARPAAAGQGEAQALPAEQTGAPAGVEQALPAEQTEAPAGLEQALPAEQTGAPAEAAVQALPAEQAQATAGPLPAKKRAAAVLVHVLKSSVVLWVAIAAAAVT